MASTKADVKLLDLSRQDTIDLLEVLGYGVDVEKGIVTKDGKPYDCPYTKRPVELDNVSIFPGTITVMNTDPLSISEYLVDHPDVKFTE